MERNPSVHTQVTQVERNPSVLARDYSPAQSREVIVRKQILEGVAAALGVSRTRKPQLTPLHQRLRAQAPLDFPWLVT